MRAMAQAPVPRSDEKRGDGPVRIPPLMGLVVVARNVTGVSRRLVRRKGPFRVGIRAFQ